jgi:hypothetical protein
MAKIFLNNVISLGVNSNVTAVSYQIAKDVNFTKIIDQSLQDTVNLTYWNSNLPKLQEDGGVGYYADLSNLYARVKVYIDNYESPWFNIAPGDQNYQNVTITKNGNVINNTTSDVINMV